LDKGSNAGIDIEGQFKDTDSKEDITQINLESLIDSISK
jgi:hypothetical protein